MAEGHQPISAPPKPARNSELVRAEFAPPPPHGDAALETRRDAIRSTLRVNPKLLPVKLLVFLIHGGVSALFPYFTLHMKSVGISVKEIAWILLILPIISSIGPPIGGALADRIGNYKIVLIIFTILSVIFHTLLWFAVPFYSTYTNTTSVAISGASFNLRIPCNGDDLSTVLAENKNRRLSNCSMSHSWRTSELRDCSSDCAKAGFRNPQVCFVGLARPDDRVCYPWEDIEYVRIEKADAKWTPVAFTIPQRNFPDQYSLTGCRVDASREGNCSVFCNAAGRNEVRCKEKVAHESGNKLTTIALYFTWRFLSFTAIRVVFPLSDAAVLEIAKQERGDFGIQRLFASVAFCLIPPFSGWMFGIATRNRGYDDYSPAFYIFGILSLMSAFLMMVMKFGIRPKQQNIWRSIGTVMLNPNVAAFVVAIFFSGCAFGVLVHYLFLFMREDALFLFKAPPFLMGLTSTVGYLCGIPLLFFSRQLIAMLGHENIVAIGMLCYAARFVLYSYTYNPFLILPTEILTGVTGMLLVVGPQFAIKYAPKYLATLVGLFGAVTFGLGGGIGPLVGGLMIHSIGYRKTFRILAGISAAVGLLYFLVYHTWLKRRTPPVAADGKTGAAERLPVITMDEVQPLAPGIETIVRNGKTVHGEPNSPGRTSTFPLEIRELDDEPRNRSKKGLDADDTFPSLKTQQERLLPDAQHLANRLESEGDIPEDLLQPGEPLNRQTGRRRSSL